MKKLLVVIISVLSLFITNVKADDFTASILDVNYDTLQEALDNAKEGETVTLLKDTTENVIIKKAITLDLNKNTIKGVGKNSTIKVTITSASELSKLVIKNGKITNDNTQVLTGAGIAVINARSSKTETIEVLIDNVEISNVNGMNGSAVYIDSGKVSIDNSNFHNNKGYNGTIYMSSTDANSTCTITNTEIHDNRVTHGGAVTVGSTNKITTATIIISKGTKVYNNYSTGNGGAVYTTGYGSKAIINGGTFYNNSALNGGAFAILDSNENFEMTSGKVYNNTARGKSKTSGHGGAIYIKVNNRGKNITISDEVVIKDNKASIGGGLYIDSYKTVTEEIVATVNAKIYNNTATIEADDIYTSGLGEKGIKLILNNTSSWKLDCNDEVDGWYIDAEDNRWNAHSENLEEISINPLKELNVTESNSIKAAHNYISKVIVHHYLVNTTTKVADDEILTGKLGEAFTATSQNPPKLKLVSSYNKVEANFDLQTKEIIFYYDYEEAQINVKYVEIDTEKELAEEEIIKGKVNDSYQTKAKEIKGYKLVKVEGNKEGILDIENPTIIYYYKAIYGTLKVKYVDEAGKELSKEETTTKQVGEEYTTSPKEFEGYELIEIKGQEKGTYTKEDIEVVYVYQFVHGTGDGEDSVEKPYTGVEENNASLLYIEAISSLSISLYLITSKKRFN